MIVLVDVKSLSASIALGVQYRSMRQGAAPCQDRACGTIEHSLFPRCRIKALLSDRVRSHEVEVMRFLGKWENERI